MSFPFRVTKNSDDTVTIHEVDIFKTHKDRGFDCNEVWMDNAVTNHDKFKSEGFRPSVIVGHNKEGQKEKPTEGVVDKLRRFGKKLFADLIVPFKFFQDMIATGKFPNRSVEVFAKGRRITALALLGGTPPHFALKQMSPYASDSGRLCYGIEDEEPVFILYKGEETDNWCRKDYQSDCKKCKNCKCIGGNMPEEKYSKDEVQGMIEEALEKQKLEIYETMFENDPGETEEEKKKREEEERKAKEAAASPSVLENQEIKTEKTEEEKKKEEKKKKEEEEAMKSELHSLQEKLAKYEENQKVLIITNNALQGKNKANALETFCMKLQKDKYAINVEEEVKYMMGLSDENLEAHKKRLPSLLSKVPSKLIKYESKPPENVDNADPEVLALYEDNKDDITKAGLTKEQFVSAQYSMGKPSGYSMAGCATGQIDESVKAYQGDDYNKG